MNEIAFYQADETIVKSLAPLLIKVLEEKKKVLIFCPNPNQMKEIDDSLWSYGRSKFIPHITFLDKDFEILRQPVFITNKEENANEAQYLVFLEEPSTSFVSGFERAFYFYLEGEFERAKNLAKKLKPKNSYKKEDGKWVKLAL